MKWVRAKDGAIFGVCKGLARSLDIPVGVFRLLWVASILFFGVGFGLYILLAITLPREDKTVEALDPWILGVCSKIALRSDLEVGIVRFLAICLALLSGGAALVGYIVLYFVLDEKKPQSSDSSPSTPPSIT
ncbi:MAG: PspC domain-containing protein [Bdellovibrionales bacterium]